MNWQLAEKLFAGGRIRVEDDGGVEGEGRKLMCLYGWGIARTVRFKSFFFLNRQCGIEKPADLKAGVSLYCKGSKRKGRKLVQDLGVEVIEGKKPMSLQV